MNNVLIDRQKIDILANAISDKSGVPVTMTLDEMVEAVDGIETSGGTPTLETVTKTYTPSTSAVTDTITPSSGYDGIEEVDVTVSAVPLAQSVDYGYSAEFWSNGNNRSWRIKMYENYDAGGFISGTQYSDWNLFSAVASGTAITPTESSQTIGGANYMMEGAVTVNAIPSNYVGSGITRRSSTDLTASGATVTVPSGYYSAQASKAVASGTAGTPTATKGTVSNHQVSVTPSVTNTTGYITGSTKTGTAVTVSASELVSGTYTVDSSGTKDVTNYASASVPAGTAGTPSASKGAVSNHSVSVTPSVTNTTGWITGSTKTGTAVTVSASELVSGSETKTENGTYDVTNLASLVVNVPSGSSKNTQIVQSTTRTNASTLTAIGAELTVSKTGTYDIYYSCFRTNTSSSYTWATRLYINGTAYGTAENATWTNNQQNTHLSNISLTTGDKLRVYGRNTRGTSYYICAPMLVIIEA